MPDKAKPLIDLWHRHSIDGALPKKSSLDLGAIKTLLPYVSMFEIMGSDRIVWRLAGSAVLEDLETNPAWANLIDLIADAQRAAVADLFLNSVRQPCGFIAEYTIKTPSGRVGLKRTLLLPLGGDEPKNLFVIGLDLSSETIGYKTAEGKPSVANDLRLIGYVDLGYGVPPKA